MFISFEGTEGVGKTTLIDGLASYLRSQQRQVTVTREPGGTPVAEQIRELLLASHSEPLHVDTELLLLYASRAQHIHTVIKPALNKHHTVLCDRFVDATVAYQCGGRGVNSERVAWLNQQFVACMPQLTFWLDAPVEVGMQRAKKRAQLDRFEQERSEFFERVRASYQQLYAQNPTRIIRLDATLDAQSLQTQAISYLATEIKHDI